MIIERIWPDNRWRNYHYLIACEETGEALAIDPLDWQLCLETATQRGWTITQILNTHEHDDHIGGNEALRTKTGARVLAHPGVAAYLGHFDQGLLQGDIVRVGRSVELETLDTPGHTRAHICMLAHGDSPALICGDTLFNAGAGNCHNGGDPNLLYQTFVNQLARLPDHTTVHPGHDYQARNLAFTVDREPENLEAKAALLVAQHQQGADAAVSSLGDEKRVNTFFRLENPAIIAGLQEKFPGWSAHPSAQDVFVKLRELRNDW